MEHLTTEDLLEIAAGVVEGVEVRDLGLLAPAAARPQRMVIAAAAGELDAAAPGEVVRRHLR